MFSSLIDYSQFDLGWFISVGYMVGYFYTLRRAIKYKLPLKPGDRMTDAWGFMLFVAAMWPAVWLIILYEKRYGRW